jgi:hypothetical protein
MTISLIYCTTELFPETFCVTTRFRDGREVTGQRLPTEEHQEYAASLGYTPDDAGVWLSLAEHEILHSLMYQWMYDGRSPALRHEAGAESCPLHLRWWEESLVISFQRWINTEELDQPLWDIIEKYPHVWRSAFEPYRQQIRATLT